MKYLNTKTGQVYKTIEEVYDNTSCEEYYDVIMSVSAGTLQEVK